MKNIELNIELENMDLEVEGYADCAGAEDYACDHDCAFLGNRVISGVD